MPLLQAMVAGDQMLILALFCIAAASDALDGYLAKRFNWTSELGRFLDPAADKLLLVSVFITAAWLDIAPWWVAAVAVARDLIIAFGALFYWLWFGPLRGPAHSHQQDQHGWCRSCTCWRLSWPAPAAFRRARYWPRCRP